MEEAEAALRALLPLLPGLALPATLPLLGGQLRAWLAGVAGLIPSPNPGQNPRTDCSSSQGPGGGLFPSLRCGLEAALLSAVAAARGVPLAALLGGGGLYAGGARPHRGTGSPDMSGRDPGGNPGWGFPGGRALGTDVPDQATIGASAAAAGFSEGPESNGPSSPSCSSSWALRSCGEPGAAVNGLLDCQGASACAAEAARLVASGFTTLKIKVCAHAAAWCAIECKCVRPV